MKVLWFTIRLMPPVAARLGVKVRGSGYWMSTLLRTLSERTDLTLGVVTARSGVEDMHFNQDGIDYFVVGRSRRLKNIRWRRQLEKCAQIAREWRPDVIHVHGTESYYGLLGRRADIDCPVAISLQGLLSEYRHCYLGSLSRWQVLRATGTAKFLRGSGLFWDRFRLNVAARRERRMLASASWVFGRTDWDRARLGELGPQATYCHVGRILRPPFYQCRWDLHAARRHSIFFTNGRAPSSGMETLIEALRLLAPQFPDVTLRLAGDPGSGYRRVLDATIRRARLSDRVKRLGYLDARRIADELSHSHVFALASHLENSSNSLAEAQLVGMPCVASHVGGVPSLIRHGHTGLLFPRADSTALARRIGALFADDDLCVRLGRAGRQTALGRHDPRRVVKQLLNAYTRAAGGKVQPRPAPESVALAKS